jgi:hypothetical protein
MGEAERIQRYLASPMSNLSHASKRSSHDELVLDDENNQMVRALVHAIAILPTASLGVADQLFVFFWIVGHLVFVFKAPR